MVQVSDSIKYKQPKKKKKKKKAFVSMLISGAFFNIYLYIYIGFIDSRMLCTIVNNKIHFISEKLIIIV